MRSLGSTAINDRIISNKTQKQNRTKHMKIQYGTAQNITKYKILVQIGLYDIDTMMI